MEFWIGAFGFATAFLGLASKLNLRLTAEERRRQRVERDLELVAVLPEGPVATRLRDAAAREAGEMLAERDRDKTEDRLTTLFLVSSGLSVLGLVALSELAGEDDLRRLLIQMFSELLSLLTLAGMLLALLAALNLLGRDLLRRSPWLDRRWRQVRDRWRGRKRRSGAVDEVAGAGAEG